MLAAECSLPPVRPHQHAHVFRGVPEPGGDPDVVPGFSRGKIVACCLERHCRKGVDHGRDHCKADAAHVSPAPGRVAVAFAQQLVRALDVLAYEAHRRHRPVPLRAVRVIGGDGERNGSPSVDRGGLSGQVVRQNASHLLDVNRVDRWVQRAPRPPPCVSGNVPERFLVTESKPHFVAVRGSFGNRMKAPDPSRLRGGVWTERVHDCRAGKLESELD